MASKVTGLNRQAEEARKELAIIEKQLTAARKAFAAEETDALVEERPLDPKSKKKVADLEAKVGEIESRIAAIGRAITEVRQREESDKGQRELDAREALKKLVAPELARLRAATFEMRNSTLSLFAILEQPENFRLLAGDRAEFIFPPADIRDRGADMARRTCQLELVNTSIEWIRDDANHSRTGPTKP